MNELNKDLELITGLERSLAKLRAKKADIKAYSTEAATEHDLKVAGLIINYYKANDSLVPVQRALAKRLINRINEKEKR